MRFLSDVFATVAIVAACVLKFPIIRDQTERKWKAKFK